MKKAFLVTANVTTRVVIDVENDEMSEKEYNNLLNQAKDKLINNLSNDYYDCIEDTREDKECPYNPSDDVIKNKHIYICPQCGEQLVQGNWDYNYDTAKLDFECPFCDWQGTDDDVDVVEQPTTIKHIGYYTNVEDLKKYANMSADEIIADVFNNIGDFRRTDDYHEFSALDFVEEMTMKFTTNGKYVVVSDLPNDMNVLGKPNVCDFFIDVYEIIE